MKLDTITPLVLTLNEEANIGRTLDALAWAGRVVVLDSGSTDGTREIVGRYPNAQLYVRPFDSHAAQWNHGITHCDIETEWVLALDADYVVTPELIAEIGALPGDGASGYRTRFTYCVAGRPLRGSVYPPVTTLFRRGIGRYEQDGHTQRLAIPGTVIDLGSPMLHDDRKPLSRWLASQNRYMELEAAKLSQTPAARLNTADRIRKLIFIAPFLVLVYSLFFRGTVLDGRPGLYYSMQRCAAETILSLHLLHRKIFY